MLYDGNNPVLKIVGVEQMEWKRGTFCVAPRPYSSLTFRIRGSVTIWTDQKEYAIKTNDILYLPQNMGYTAEYTDTKIIVVHFVTLQDDTEVEVYPFQNGELLYKLFLQAYLLWKNKEPGFPVYVMARLYGILGNILENETKTNMPEHFLNGISFINANYRNSTITVDLVCAEAGISPTVFRRLFHEYYQKTPTQYITELRLEYARNLISGGVSIENAAYESGFNDPKYFSRVVKQRFNCTPRNFKTYGK